MAVTQIKAGQWHAGDRVFGSEEAALRYDHVKSVFDAWIAEHPEYVDSKDNGLLVGIALRKLKGDPRSTTDIDDVVDVLNKAGLLEIVKVN